MTTTTSHIYLKNFGDGKPITKVNKLPGGEFHPKVGGYDVAMSTNTVIHTRLRNGDDLLELLTLTNALKEYGFKSDKISVHIPYFPGGRQDRVCNQGEAFTIKVYADIINSQNYDKVFILDPHSDVTPALINNCVVLGINNIISKIVSHNRYDVIVIPDAGAIKKTHDYYLKNIDLLDTKIVQGLKHRDTKTGKLSGFSILCDREDIEDKKIVILDDICDGGGTFCGLASEIRKYDPESLDLYVTHGIFSNGLSQILGSFDYIYTTNSFYSRNEYLHGYFSTPNLQILET